MNPTPAELEKVLADWQAFAQTKVYAFRGISDAAYRMFAPAYFRAIVERSRVYVLRDNGAMVACVVTEDVPDSDTVIVHWCWTEFAHRNTDCQDILWEKSGLLDHNVFISHLTVLAEKFCAKYGFLFNPFPLYKGGLRDSSEQSETEAGHDNPYQRVDVHGR